MPTSHNVSHLLAIVETVTGKVFSLKLLVPLKTLLPKTIPVAAREYTRPSDPIDASVSQRLALKSREILYSLRSTHTLERSGCKHWLQYPSMLFGL